MVANPPLSRFRKLVVTTSIFHGRIILEPQSSFFPCIKYTLRNYKCWKTSIYEHIRIRILARRVGAASGGVDHSVVTHHDRRDESFSFAYPAYYVTVLHSNYAARRLLCLFEAKY